MLCCHSISHWTDTKPKPKPIPLSQRNSHTLLVMKGIMMRGFPVDILRALFATCMFSCFSFNKLSVEVFYLIWTQSATGVWSDGGRMESAKWPTTSSVRLDGLLNLLSLVVLSTSKDFMSQMCACKWKRDQLPLLSRSPFCPSLCALEEWPEQTAYLRLPCPLGSAGVRQW